MTFTVIALSTLLVVSLLYWFPIRRSYRRWGATEADLRRAMLGDGEVPNPNYETTLAITIDRRGTSCI